MFNPFDKIVAKMGDKESPAFPKTLSTHYEFVDSK